MRRHESKAGQRRLFSLVPRSEAAAQPSAPRSLFAGRSRRIIEELLTILPELDEAGLIYLLDQAKLRRYALRAERRGLEAAREVRGSLRLAATADGALRIDRSADGSTYHIVAGSTWKMFTAEETAALVRISRLALSEAEAGRALYEWLGGERRDVLVDLAIEGAESARLCEIIGLLRKTFPVRAPRRLA